jgi:twitching motility protein PilJ
VAIIRKDSGQIIETADYVKQPSDQAKKEGIFETARSVSEQTNLLVLTATNEAVRASEAGSGFAVVTDEIKKTTEESRDATRSMDRILREIDQSTKTIEVVQTTTIQPMLFRNNFPGLRTK